MNRLSNEALRKEFLPRFLAWRRLVEGGVRDALAYYRLDLPAEELAGLPARDRLDDLKSVALKPAREKGAVRLDVIDDQE